MENEIEVVQTHTTVEVGKLDKVAVTVLSALAGLVVSSLTEKAYFAGKARWTIARSKTD